ncbi:MAG: T9SS type A sorting domain-containing protein [Bacteroidota bacterium]
MKHIPYARKKRQLSVLADKLKHLILYHKEEAIDQIKKLVVKIKKLVQELLFVISHIDLKKILGAVALIIGISFTNKTTAQSFAGPIENPFGLVSTLSFAIPTFADLDGDDDFDLLVGEGNNYNGNMQYFENIGSETIPLFSAPQLNPFGLVSVYRRALPTFVDLDDDGDIDLLVGEGIGYYGAQVYYFENIGSPTDPQFTTPQLNPFGLTIYSEIKTTFADLDGDGDLDLLYGKQNGALYYNENIGSSVNPQFAPSQENPFGLSAVDFHAAPDFVNLDNDGDMDLLVGENSGAMQYFENIGSSVNPQFAPPQENPFGLSAVDSQPKPDFVDLDNDGDMDLLVGEYYGVMQYFENTSINSVSEIDQNNLLVYPNPVNDILHIETEANIYKIEIFNVLGKKVVIKENIVKQVSLNKMKPGIYTVKIILENNNCIVRKIIKK